MLTKNCPPRSSNILLSVLSALSILLAACAQAPQPETAFVQTAQVEQAAAEEASAETGLIAELRSTSGSRISFLDEGDSVGVLELTSAGQAATLPDLSRRFNPTGLELFLALAPEGSAVPAQLRAAHSASAERRADLSAEPRDLSTSLRSNVTGPLDRSWCRSSFAFETNFHNFFFSGFGYAHEGYGLDLVWNKNGVTGVASRRALAACNRPLHTPFASATPVEVRVEAQIGANLWVLVGGTNKTLANEAGMYYFSDGLTAQRYRIVARPHPWAIYSLAGAWGGTAPY